MSTSVKPEDHLALLMRRLLKLRLAEIPRLDYELSLSQMELLLFIRSSTNCRVQDIANGLGITPPTVSVALKRLEDAGWLERHPDPEDGRATCSALTEKGMEMMENVRTAQVRGVEKFLMGLTVDEKDQLIRLLEKAIISAEGRIGEASE
ncbi:MAG: MarR family transcriptional regulator [Anaerolineales bacterium]|jgi:DNA-binding MarR family transcriptional regulator